MAAHAFFIFHYNRTHIQHFYAISYYAALGNCTAREGEGKVLELNKKCSWHVGNNHHLKSAKSSNVHDKKMFGLIDTLSSQIFLQSANHLQLYSPRHIFTTWLHCTYLYLHYRYSLHEFFIPFGL